MPIQHIQTTKAPAAIGPYSQGIVANGLLFTAGQIALDPATGTMSSGSVAEQTEIVISNLEAVLAAAGATWDDAVKVNIYLVEMADFSVVNEIYGKRLGGARPARATVQVSALPRGALIEMDAVAAVK